MLLGVFITALYTFRAFFMTFHGELRAGHEAHGHEAHPIDAPADDAKGHDAAHQAPAHEEKDAHPNDDHGEPRESPAVVTVPLILLAIPSALIGWFTVKPMLFGGYFGGAIQVLPPHDVLARLGEEFDGSGMFVISALTSVPLWLALSGVFCAWLFFLKKPSLADSAERSFKWLHRFSSTSTASIGSTSM